MFILDCHQADLNKKYLHPRNKRMFYICLDKYRYKIFTCPNNGQFDNGICHGIEPDEDICLKQKCLNGGTCVHLHNHLYECLCP